MKVAAIHLYPVKSLRGHDVSQSEVDLIGLKGDRRWLVVDENNRFQTMRDLPHMAQVIVECIGEGLILSHPDFGQQIVKYPISDSPRKMVTVWRDTVEAVQSERMAAEFLSAVLGKSVQLVFQANSLSRPVDQRYGQQDDHVSFADGYPILVTTTASLADLELRCGTQISMQRFRPNIVIDGAEAWAEDTWREIRVGRITYRVAKPCGRCIVTTRDPNTGKELDKYEPLKTLGRFHRSSDGNIIFGQNIIPEGTGEVCVGDAVTVIKSGPSNLK